METSPRLRRSKSLKSILSARKRRDSVLEAEDNLPPPPYTASKPTLVHLHVTAEDFGLKPLAPRPRTSSLAVPSARNTWPQGLREQRPGAYAFRETPTLVRTPWSRTAGFARLRRGHRGVQLPARSIAKHSRDYRGRSCIVCLTICEIRGTVESDSMCIDTVMI